MSQEVTKIKKRIASVSGALKVTSAMKLVSTVKLKKWKNKMLNNREYSNTLGDITKLVLSFAKKAKTPFSVVNNDTDKNLYIIVSSTLLEVLDFSKRDIIMINTALEEVFVNVAKYAYEGSGEVEVSLSNDKNKVTFVFRDSGKPFNPLTKEDPNINASSEEREVGGLGIYMVKNIMDNTHYEYKDGHNVLTLVKYRNKK